MNNEIQSEQDKQHKLEVESCGCLHGAKKTKSGKYVAFIEDENGSVEFIENKEFDTPSDAINASLSYFN